MRDEDERSRLACGFEGRVKILGDFLGSECAARRVAPENAGAAVGAGARVLGDALMHGLPGKRSQHVPARLEHHGRSACTAAIDLDAAAFADINQPAFGRICPAGVGLEHGFAGGKKRQAGEQGRRQTMHRLQPPRIVSHAPES